MTSLCSQLAWSSPAGTSKTGIRSMCDQISSYDSTRSAIISVVSAAPGTSLSQYARISAADLR